MKPTTTRQRARKIPVSLTVAQWNALHSVGVGELESLTDGDRESGLHKDLEDALTVMEDARKKQAR